MSRRATVQLACPTMVLVMLCAQAAETWHRPRASEAEPYHQMVYQKQAELPQQLGMWSGTDGEVIEAAVRLLRPNFIYNRNFVNQATGRRVTVLVVHCKDARDLEGHYPPRCYPNQGYELRQAMEREWEIGGHTVPAMEYHFATRMFGEGDLIVHNFIIMPDGRIVRDMASVARAAGDFTQRFFGAGQVQVVFADGNLRADERDAITQRMIEAHMEVIEAIRTGADR